MSNTILKAENISKQYRLGSVGAATLSDDLKRWWYGIRGKEDPFLKLGSVNDRSVRAKEDYVWALKDISFEVKQGEVMGIIGKNGAGKSTLLKILSRVTSPTTGSIKTKGRIASLLEVGTGFHPEMTGRENIFMNGAVLGMTKAEIKRKLDEIIAFSGCEKYIDTPVKRYSSGMTVRLGFAVAAHLEPEILVVDEVLAVGDAEFQKKAIGKMQDLSTGEGRTVLFVSHNMMSIQNLCKSCMVLDSGSIGFIGDVDSAIEEYYFNESDNEFIKCFSTKLNMNGFKSFIHNISLRNTELKPQRAFKMGEKFVVRIGVNLLENLENIAINVRLNDKLGNRIAAWRTGERGVSIKFAPKFQIDLQIEDLNIFNGIYNLSVALVSNNQTIDLLERIIDVEIIPTKIDLFPDKIVGKKNNLIYTPCSWRIVYE